MTEFFADLGFVVAVTAGLLAFFGVSALAAWTSPKSLRHPDGRAGRFRDEMIALGPLAPFLVLVLTGAFQPDMREQAWWTASMFSVAGAGLLAHLLPVVRRARQRVSALHRYPSQ